MGNKNKIILLVLLLSVIASLLLISGCLNRTLIHYGTIQKGSIVWDGVERTYLFYIPPSYVKNKPMPLVIVLHGGGGSGRHMIILTKGGFNKLADEEGFIVVYPDGMRFSKKPKARWNDGRDERWSQSDDAGFLMALIDRFVKEFNVDKKRIYITGISNGAHMAMRMVREHTDKIAAVAVVAYAMPEKFSSIPVATRPISVLLISGTEDPITPWEGGEVPDPTGKRMLGKILSVPNTIKVLVTHNNCLLEPRVTWEPDNDPYDGTRVRKEVYEGCKEGTEVILYTIEGGGHTWPGGYQYLSKIFIGKTSRDIDANEVIWNFLKKYSRE